MIGKFDRAYPESKSKRLSEVCGYKIGNDDGNGLTGKNGMIGIGGRKNGIGNGGGGGINDGPNGAGNGNGIGGGGGGAT
jgi:hypothetical protein